MQYLYSLNPIYKNSCQKVSERSEKKVKKEKNTIFAEEKRE